MYNIIMAQPVNKCNKFLNPQPNKYNNVIAVDDLNIGILTASKKLFDLGVKYTKDMFITITTAQVTVLVEASLKSVEHFMDKLKENPMINQIITNQAPKIVGLLDSSENILRYIGYDYLTKSYYNYASANKPFSSDQDLTQDGVGFKKLLDLVSTSNNMKTHSEGSITHSNKLPLDNSESKMNENTKDMLALTVADKITNDIMKLTPELRETELLKVAEIIRKKIEMNREEKKVVQNGGRGAMKLKSRRHKHRNVIRKMIKRTIRKFCNVYPRINK